MSDMPWPMWVYVGIGIPIALWYQRRQGNPENDHALEGRRFLILFLALIWPVLLLAVAANQPDKPKQSSPKPPEEKANTPRPGNDS